MFPAVTDASTVFSTGNGGGVAAVGVISGRSNVGSGGGAATAPVCPVGSGGGVTDAGFAVGKGGGVLLSGTLFPLMFF